MMPSLEQIEHAVEIEHEAEIEMLNAAVTTRTNSTATWNARWPRTRCLCLIATTTKSKTGPQIT
jgi:hypothetical protein